MDFKKRLKDSSDSDLANIAKTEFLYKVLVIGDYGVGKSAIVRRYTENKFSSTYKITIGADFALKTIHWNSRTKINLQLWDIAGHERFGYMARVYYKYAIAAAIVFDLTRKNTFDSIERWLAEIRQKVFLPNGSDIPVVILANKTDMNQSVVTGKQISQFCRDNGIDGWFLTSAKENINIDTAMEFLIDTIQKGSRHMDFATDSFQLTKNIKSKKKIPCDYC